MSDSEKRHGKLESSRSQPEEVHESKLSPKTIAKVLQDRQRRLICHILANSSTVTTFDDLIDALSDRELNAPESDTEFDRRSASIQLHHVHLPLLEDIGVIEYEPRCGTIRYWGHSRIERRLDRLSDIA
ncbi:DUF7344 domain-containing protein [Haladaptatus caseinilyticus]|uniref:DUF7344 domain-containing protein n=1 Tax=Haladaptatus caseinilyticus TaxID=2993314 RepID=UPI00224B6617|nr:hypothetical protein [Haladaptatus caseinilyticus]